MKTCNICQKEKPIDDFYKQNASLDGLQNLCKDCAKLHSKEVYQACRKERIEQAKAWQVKNKAKRAAYMRKYRARQKK